MIIIILFTAVYNFLVVLILIGDCSSYKSGLLRIQYIQYLVQIAAFIAQCIWKLNPKTDLQSTNHQNVCVFLCSSIFCLYTFIFIYAQ